MFHPLYLAAINITPRETVHCWEKGNFGFVIHGKNYGRYTAGIYMYRISLSNELIIEMIGSKVFALPGRCCASWNDESQAGHQQKEYGHYEAGHFGCCCLFIQSV